MKVLYGNEEIELNTEIEEGAKELDMLTPIDNEEMNKIDLEDTIKIDINEINNELESMDDKNE